MEAIEQNSRDDRVRHIVDESLRGFRNEIINMIADGFRYWRIRFTGDSSDVTVDEFIYRINTDANSRGDYNLLCQHVHIIFDGKALKWFWRFHRICGEIVCGS